MAKCPICGGTGDTKNNIPPTNEQWFCGLSTEEKAKCLTNISFNTGYDSYNVVFKKMVEWLKQPHRGEP